MQSSEFTPSPRFDDQPELGDIKINHNVVASIVRLAALQVPGVAGVGGGIVDGISELFSKRRESDHRGVRVNETDEDTYAIELRIIIKYGFEIGKTAYEVQVAVRKQVIAMTEKTWPRWMSSSRACACRAIRRTIPTRRRIFGRTRLRLTKPCGFPR